MKILMIMLVVALSLTTKVFAKTNDVPPTVVASFQSEFPEAQNVQWKQSSH